MLCVPTTSSFLFLCGVVHMHKFCLKLPQVHKPFSCKNPEHDFKTIPPSTFRWSNLTLFTASFMILDLNVMKIWSLEEWKFCGPWYMAERNSHFQLTPAQKILMLRLEKNKSMLERSLDERKKPEQMVSMGEVGRDSDRKRNNFISDQKISPSVYIKPPKCHFSHNGFKYFLQQFQNSYFF